MSLYIPKMSDTPGVTIPGLADNFTLLAGSRIVESGSNENGEYWRWENGLQICTLVFTVAERTKYTLWYDMLYGTFEYPAEFHGGVRAQITPVHKVDEIPSLKKMMGGSVDSSSRMVRIYARRAEYEWSDSDRITLYITLVGRWK